MNLLIQRHTINDMLRRSIYRLMLEVLQRRPNARSGHSALHRADLARRINFAAGFSALWTRLYLGCARPIKRLQGQE
jgi:hypothetical protein